MKDSTPSRSLPGTLAWVKSLLTSYSHFGQLSLLILLGEAVLGFLIIRRVAYTEIDWEAYMQEVAGFLGGELDYRNLAGGTGPLVYPAGFVYLYSALYYITDWGLNVRFAQYLFLALYLAFHALVLVIYYKTQLLPPWAVLMLSMSKRIHSIFMLRLFNDCFAMIFLYLAIVLFLYDRWATGCFFFSFAVSIKMNVLLFAPALLLLLWRRFGFLGSIRHLSICAGLQILLGLPFLLTYPVSYISRAFEFSRQFMYKWTVNFKFLPEDIFLQPSLSLALLLTHVVVLVVAMSFIEEGGLSGAFRKSLCFRGPDASLAVSPSSPSSASSSLARARRIVTPLFVANFIGIVFSRSLHYQFYVWYFHALPYLLWLAPLPVWFRPLILLVIELCWNTFPASILSSGALTLSHLTILGGIMYALYAKARQLEKAQPKID